MTRIYIDADACPVKEEAKRVAARHGLEVFLVSNGGIRPDPSPLVHLVVVSAGPDEADKWIAEEIGPGDICVTSDIPLAARCVEAGGTVLRPDGAPLTARNIGEVLATRDLMSDLRSADPFRQGGGRPFSKQDRSRFLDSMERLVQAARRGA
ncbi:YaiI/YqxD family protein [Paroceanicella profunda]|uniref:UPF0178 protein FDP22_13115 n=1 Tax=Paroceanicella profunda TaxID=2579971 RepID=A0A5B8G240_9RHOB|nr:YaiI/YqxD family protein [Paroceanicella profunda]QDL92643.1 YaiI/YqxD family protein [Paroceanicella profunda]